MYSISRSMRSATVSCRDRAHIATRGKTLLLSAECVILAVRRMVRTKHSRRVTTVRTGHSSNLAIIFCTGVHWVAASTCPPILRTTRKERAHDSAAHEGEEPPRAKLDQHARAHDDTIATAT